MIARVLVISLPLLACSGGGEEPAPRENIAPPVERVVVATHSPPDPARPDPPRADSFSTTPVAVSSSLRKTEVVTRGRSPIVPRGGDDRVRWSRTARVAPLEVNVVGSDSRPAPGITVSVVPISGVPSDTPSAVMSRERFLTIRRSLIEEALQVAVVSGDASPFEAPRRLLSTTDEQGRATFDRVPCGHVLVCAQGDGSHRPPLFDSTLIEHSDERLSVALAIDPARPIVITGRVVDLRGEPIMGATVRWSLTEQRQFPPLIGSPTPAWGSRPAHVDADGRFTLRGRAEFRRPRRGQQDWPILAASAPGYLNEFIGLRPEMTEADFALRPVVNIRGQGPPDSVATLWIPAMNQGETGWEIANWSHGLNGVQRLTRQSPEFHWGPTDLDDIPAYLLPMPAWVMVHGEAGVAIADLVIDTTPDQDIDLGTLRPQPALTLRGRVVRESGEPAARVRVRWEGGGDLTRRCGDECPVPDQRWIARTDDDGQFEIYPLPPGHWRLRLNGRSSPDFEVDLQHGDNTLREFTLPDPPEIMSRWRCGMYTPPP